MFKIENKWKTFLQRGLKLGRFLRILNFSNTLARSIASNFPNFLLKFRLDIFEVVVNQLDGSKLKIN